MKCSKLERKKDTERLKNDKTFWEFVKEGEAAMRIPEKEKIAASSFEQQEDFNNDIAVERGVAKNKETKVDPLLRKRCIEEICIRDLEICMCGRSEKMIVCVKINK